MTNNLTRYGSSTETINFNGNGVDKVITNVIYTTTNALGVQEKPFEGPDIIHDLGVSDILVFVTGLYINIIHIIHKLCRKFCINR